MIAALPILILIPGAAALIVVRRFRPKFAYHWLAAVLLALVAWIAALVGRAFLPFEFPFLTWETGLPVPVQLRLFFDEITWGYMLALATLLLSTLLTAAARGGETSQPRPSAPLLAGGLVLTALCMIAVAAGDLITFQLAWAAALMFEWIIWLPQVLTREGAQNLGLEIGLRLIGLLLLFGGALAALSAGTGLEGFNIAPLALPMMLAAAGLRLGVLPPHTPPTHAAALSPALGPLLRLATCAPALLLLARLAEDNPAFPSVPLLVALIVISAWRAGASLIAGGNRLSSRLDWIAAAGTLALAGALYALPQVVFVWSVALLLAGGALLQHAIRPAWLQPLFWITAIGLTGLAFMPTWPGAALYDPPGAVQLLILIGQGLLVAGYVIQAGRPGPTSIGPERWIWALYFAGLALGLLMMFAIPLVAFPASPAELLARINLDSLLPGVLVCALALVVLGLRRLAWKPLAAGASGLQALLGLEWLYRSLARLIGPFQIAVRFFHGIMEGQAGMIWAFLLLVLFLTLISQPLSGITP